MKVLVSFTVLVSLLVFPVCSVATDTLIKDLRDGTVKVELTGYMDSVLHDAFFTGDRQFVLRDNSGTILVQITALHSIIGSTGSTRVHVTGVVQRDTFGFGRKFIRASRVEIIEDGK